jgi:hypothetical protein
MACSAPGDREFSSSPAEAAARPRLLLAKSLGDQAGRGARERARARLAALVRVLWREGDPPGAGAGIANCAQDALDRVFDFGRVPVVAETHDVGVIVGRRRAWSVRPRQEARS